MTPTRAAAGGTNGDTTGPGAGHRTFMTRPDADAVVPTTGALRWQARRCRASDAPIAAAICEAVADNLDTGGVLAGLFPAQVRAGDQVGLRTMAVVHLLARTGVAPSVASHLPTCGAATTTPHPQLAAAVVAALAANPDALADGLAHIPQTNEAGRATALRCVLSRLHLPVRLVELGASAGLNLRADALEGDPASEAGPLPPITQRLGCDLHPIDPTTPQGRDRLHSYIWVDHVDRSRRLDKAIGVAARIPAEVITADVTDLAARVTTHTGVATVVWHSLVWRFLPPTTRTNVLDSLSAAGTQAGPDALLVHAGWEPLGDADDRSGLTVAVWQGAPDDGVGVVAATGDHHGRQVTLTGLWPPPLGVSG